MSTTTKAVSLDLHSLDLSKHSHSPQGPRSSGPQSRVVLRALRSVKSNPPATCRTNNQDTVRAGVDLAQRNPELARNAASLAASNPDAARAAVSMASSGGTTAI